jgi:uncharacterized membrane protein YqjE
MSQNTRPDPAGYKGALENVRGFLAHAVEMFQIRLELALLESKHALAHFLFVLALAGAALVGAALAYLLVVFSLALALVEWAGWSLLQTVLLLAALHAVAAAAFGWFAFTRLKRPVFQATIAELQKDKEWLAPKKKDV